MSTQLNYFGGKADTVQSGHHYIWNTVKHSDCAGAGRTFVLPRFSSWMLADLCRGQRLYQPSLSSPPSPTCKHKQPQPWFLTCRRQHSPWMCYGQWQRWQGEGAGPLGLTLACLCPHVVVCTCAEGSPVSGAGSGTRLTSTCAAVRDSAKPWQCSGSWFSPFLRKIKSSEWKCGCLCGVYLTPNLFWVCWPRNQAARSESFLFLFLFFGDFYHSSWSQLGKVLDKTPPLNTCWNEE